MPKFSKSSTRQLISAHADLQTLFLEVIQYFDCKVIEGHRSIERQQELFHKGFSKVDGVKIKGKHNYTPSLALDVVPYPIDWNNTKRMYFFGGFVKGIAEKLHKENKIKHRLRWGGDWDSDTEVTDQTFIDLPHFELIINQKN